MFLKSIVLPCIYLKTKIKDFNPKNAVGLSVFFYWISNKWISWSYIGQAFGSRKHSICSKTVNL